ncbi:MAG: dihydrofolate reductase family protein [Myxococcales bacterium]
MSRKMIAALQISLDGFTQASDRGEPEWVDSWADALHLISDVDAFVQGGRMHPAYGEHWSAVERDPTQVPPYMNRLPNEREVAYAKLAAKSPHYVFSRTLERVAWPPNTQIVRDLEPLRVLKRQPGKNIYVVGGPTLVVALLNADLLDELRLIVHPLLLAGGRPLFAGVEKRRALTFVGVERTPSGKVILTYETRRG